MFAPKTDLELVEGAVRLLSDKKHGNRYKMIIGTLIDEYDEISKL